MKLSNLQTQNNSLELNEALGGVLNLKHNQDLVDQVLRRPSTEPILTVIADKDAAFSRMSTLKIIFKMFFPPQ